MTRASAVLILAGLWGSPVAADDNALEGGDEIIVVVGSHGREGRTIVDSPVAIDVIDADRVATQTGQLDLNRVLHLAAPSFNANRQSGADGADHIEPATLRGMGPDQTLVLVNGKRRHQSSLINLFGTRGRGATGTDLAAIPLAAVERIEILRDGASALYGSDAIAGVINIVLKDRTGRIDAWVDASTQLARPPSSYDVARGKRFDGQTVHASANYGVPLGDGFVNLTLDYLNRAGTERPANPEMFTAYRRRFGTAAGQRLSTVVNAEAPLGAATVFAHGTYTHRTTNAFAWTREPDSDRNVPEIYPEGFDPRITSVAQDAAGTFGVRGDGLGWGWELSSTLGVNQFRYTIKDTLNASLLAASPTSFDAGGHSFLQSVTGGKATRSVDWFKKTEFTVGAEWRADRFRITAGEEGSYRNYGLVEQTVDGQRMVVDTLGRPGGSQGFPGYQPANEVNEWRQNGALYAGAVFDITGDLRVDVASRYERYSDFGSTLGGKVAARLELVDLLGLRFAHHLALRGSASTGFRAPSLAQLYYNSVFTDFQGGVPVDKVIARNDGPISRAVGIPRLKEETATNVGAGLSMQMADVRVSLDGYLVDVRDRVVLSGAFDQSDEQIGGELAMLNVGAAQFFANALDTRSMGLDFVLDGRFRFGQHSLLPQVSANINRMTLGDLKLTAALAGKEDAFFGRRERQFLLASAPRSKLTAGLGYEWKSLFANARATRFDRVVLIDWTDAEDIYRAKWTADASLGWQFGDDMTLILGGTNVFNVYPTQQDTETESGGLWDAVQMGAVGAQYYVKLRGQL